MTWSLKIYDSLLSLFNGEIEGAKRIVIDSRGVGTTSATVLTNIPSGYTAINYAPLETAEAWEIVSAGANRANDTAAGDGAQAVTLIGIDSTGAEATVTVELNGDTPVDFSGTWLCVNSLEVTRCGDNKVNEGDLILRVQDTTSGSNRAYISVDICRSNLMRYRAPSGKKLFLRKLAIYSLEYGVSHLIEIKSYNPTTKVYKTISTYNIADGNLPMELDLGGRSIEEGCEVVVFSSLSAGTFTFGMSLIMDEI